MTAPNRNIRNTNNRDQNARQLRADFLASMINALGGKIRKAFTPSRSSRC